MPNKDMNTSDLDYVEKVIRGGAGTMNRSIKIGIIAAPERAAEITNSLINYLPDEFHAMIDNEIEWDVEWQVDPLTGAAETAQEIIYNAHVIKQRQDWDYAICLTDLPIFHDGKVVVADISLNDQVGQISIPSYAFPPMEKRISRTIVEIVNEMHDQAMNQTKGTVSESHTKKKKTYSFKRRFLVVPVQREEEPHIYNATYSDENYNQIKDDKHDSEVELSEHDKNEKNQEDTTDNEANGHNIDIRFLIFPKTLGKLWVLIGMTFSNNPLKIMSSFKSVMAIAFTTGAFAMIFPTIWKLSQIFTVTRLSLIMVFAILGLVSWIIVVHGLWEVPSSKNKPLIRRLYNSATASTLIIDVTGYYLALYLLFFIAAVVFIPPDYLESTIPDNNHSSFINYMRVAWAEASIATIVSAMGAGLEDETKVRHLTYGYRQRQRYKEMKKHFDS